MRWSPRIRLAGVTPAFVLAFGAGVAFPRALGEHDSSRALESERKAVAPRWVDRIDAQLVSRWPQLDDPDRRRVAWTLVGEAEAAGIDPLLVLALIRVESSYDPGALSTRGARGLMQLRGPTLRREVERAGLEWDDAQDPAVNVQAGIRYLRRLLDAFKREEVALMAYNAGPNRILGYLRDGEIPERFRVYPRKVIAEVRRLRRSFADAPTPVVALARPVSAPE